MGIVKGNLGVCDYRDFKTIPKIFRRVLKKALEISDLVNPSLRLPAVGRAGRLSLSKS